MTETAVLEARSWCMKIKTCKIQVEGPGAEWARKAFTDGGFETGIITEMEKQNHRLKRNPES